MRVEASQGAASAPTSKPASTTGSARVVLYRILDESTLDGVETHSIIETLNAVLTSDATSSQVPRHWVVGRFGSDALHDACIDALDQAGARWIEAGESAERCTVTESGRFVPDPRLLRLLDVHADSGPQWLMPWPWHCALPASAERDLLQDLENPVGRDVRFAFLRRHDGGAEGTQEPDFAYAGMLLPVLAREGIAECSLVDVDASMSRRAGWALAGASLDKLRAGGAESFPAPAFHIGICLRAKACTHDWPLTCRNLERTLENLSRQRGKTFRVWIAVHERPEIRTFGLDIEYVVVDFPPPIREDGTFGNDKRRKRNAIGDALRAFATSGFYYLQLDADDLIDVSLVQATLVDDNRRGYLIQSGYIYDMQQRRAARCDDATVPFWRQCGSSAVLYFEPDDLRRGEDDESYFERQRFHEQFASLAEQRGRELAPWVDDMALYLVNHGENHWSAYRYEAEGRADSKSKFVHRHRLVAKAEIEMLSLRYPELGRGATRADEPDREVTTS